MAAASKNLVEAQRIASHDLSDLSRRLQAELEKERQEVAEVRTESTTERERSAEQWKRHLSELREGFTRERESLLAAHDSSVQSLQLDIARLEQLKASVSQELDASQAAVRLLESRAQLLDSENRRLKVLFALFSAARPVCSVCACVCV